MTTMEEKKNRALLKFVRGVFQPKIQPVIDAAKECRFLDTFESRVDASHWGTIVDDINKCMQGTDEMTLTRVDEFAPELMQPKVDLDFLLHMMKAFAAGDRFVVAKLAYDGAA